MSKNKRQGVSLREVARTLKYAVSSLSEARGLGHFEALDDGSYSVQDVARGLLDSCDLRADRRELLEAVAAGSDEPQRPPQSQQRSAPGTQRFDAKTEVRITACQAPYDLPEVQEAFEVLGGLPFKMMNAYFGDARPADPLVAEGVFLEAVVERLGQYVEAIREDREEANPNAELIGAVAAVAGKKL